MIGLPEIDLAQHLRGVARYWDAAADRYLALYRDELAAKPYDREILDAFAARIGAGGRVCDAGCGPCGHVAAHLASRGLEVLGVDLSPRCVALARVEHPALRFEVMDMGALALEDGALDGVIACYAFHYQPKRTLPSVVRELGRVLRPGGQLLIVAKEGAGERWIDDPMGGATQVFWAAFTAPELESLAAENGFRVDGSAARDPRAGEIAARRLYVAATKSSATHAPRATPP